MENSSSEVNKLVVGNTIQGSITGFLFFLVLMAMLRSLRRERKLLEEITDLRIKLSEMQAAESE